MQELATTPNARVPDSIALFTVDSKSKLCIKRSSISSPNRQTRSKSCGALQRKTNHK